MDLLLLIVGLLFCLIGIVGSFLPIIPGPVSSWLGILLLNLTSVVEFNLNFVLITLTVAISVGILDYLIPVLGVKKLGGEMGAPEWYEILQAVVEAMEPYSRHGLNVNVDFYSGVIYQLHGIAMDLYVPIFAIGRMPGWIIQCLEQLRSNILIRPLTLYNGPQIRPYLEIKDRPEPI